MTSQLSNIEPGAGIHIGSRRELLVDDHLIAALSRDAELRLHRPVPQEVALETDAPWEGNASGYVTVFQDDDRYLMYYRGWHFTHDAGSLEFAHPEVVCLAESSDGINWSKPNLGLVEFDGSRNNNIILDARDDSSPAINFVPFKDPNPDAPAAERYKALANNRGYKGLIALSSPDGIHWTQMRDEPVITKGYFDSQTPGLLGRRTRRIPRLPPRLPPRPRHHDLCLARLPQLDRARLHRLQPHPHRRALHQPGHPLLPRPPHFRRLPRPATWSAPGRLPSKTCPNRSNRRMRSAARERYGAALTDGLFMSSRDGMEFNIWPEAFIRPGLRPQDNWTYGDNYPALGPRHHPLPVRRRPR